MSGVISKFSIEESGESDNLPREPKLLFPELLPQYCCAFADLYLLEPKVGGVKASPVDETFPECGDPAKK